MFVCYFVSPWISKRVCYSVKIIMTCLLFKHVLFGTQAFGASNRFWKILVQKIYDVLEVDWESRRPEDGMMVERILLLVRNLLHTPPTSDDFKKAPEELTSHDKLLWLVQIFLIRLAHYFLASIL